MRIFHRSDKAITLKICSRSPHTLYTKVLCRWRARLGQRERNNSWNKVYDLTFDPENWFMVIAHPNAFCGWIKSQIGPTGKKICSEKMMLNKQTNKLIPVGAPRCWALIRIFGGYWFANLKGICPKLQSSSISVPPL